MSKKKQSKSTETHDRLAIQGSFDDVINASMTNLPTPEPKKNNPTKSNTPTKKKK